MTDTKRSGGWKQLGFVALLSLPAIFCVCASNEFSTDSDYQRSALWFIFQISQYIGVVCILIGAGLCIAEYVQARISRVALALMIGTVLASIYLLWLGIHIYRSPWF
jgi:hypothetical protein